MRRTAKKLGKYKFSKAGVKKTVKEVEAIQRGEKPKGWRFFSVARPATAKEALAARKASHMTQTKFAAALGVSPITIRSWERGRRKPGAVETKVLRAALVDPRIVETLAAI